MLKKRKKAKTSHTSDPAPSDATKETKTEEKQPATEDTLVAPPSIPVAEVGA
jgi:hypothetical protein